MKTREEKIEAVGRVMDVLDRLRVECPWDRKQTNESLRSNTIEEVYELADAIIANDNDNIRKELGDVLLHILFYSKIGEEKGEFDIVDVCDSLNAKLIFRHPHVFGNVVAEDSETVVQNWEALKLKEKGGNKTVLAGVPSSLPALIKAFAFRKRWLMWDLTGRSRRRYGIRSGRNCRNLNLKRRYLMPIRWRRKWAMCFLLWSMPHVSTVSILRMLSNGPTASL